MAAPLSTEVLYASYGVLHELRAKEGKSTRHENAWDHIYSSPTPLTYPAVNLNIDGVKIAIGSANVDELNQRPNTDALQKNIHIVIKGLNECHDFNYEKTCQ